VYYSVFLSLIGHLALDSWSPSGLHFLNQQNVQFFVFCVESIWSYGVHMESMGQGKVHNSSAIPAESSAIPMDSGHSCGFWCQSGGLQCHSCRF
jgi:hypothetical protein